jgi:hypothetical protein
MKKKKAQKIDGRQMLHRLYDATEECNKRIFQTAMQLDSASRLLALSCKSPDMHHREILLGLGYTLCGIKEELSAIYSGVDSVRYGIEGLIESKAGTSS